MVSPAEAVPTKELDTALAPELAIDCFGKPSASLKSRKCMRVLIDISQTTPDDGRLLAEVVQEAFGGDDLLATLVHPEEVCGISGSVDGDESKLFELSRVVFRGIEWEDESPPSKAHMESRRQCLEMEPRKLNTVENVDKLGFQRFVCKGVYDKQRSIYVGPKPRSIAQGSEIGFYVIKPLLPIPNEPNSMKSPILVNRGWVPLDWEEESLEYTEAGDVVVATEKANEPRRANKLPSSQLNPLSKDQVSKAMHVEVVGVVRKSSLAWFFLDVPKLAQAMGFGEGTIYVEKTHEDMDESRPYPALRNVEDLILSKKLPLELFDFIALWSAISMACFAKWNTCIMQRYGKGEPGDTIGVGCVTKLDPGKKDEVKDSIDWNRVEIDERTWNLNSFA
ncbi:hypothetical protein Bca52824_034866 [Brassica carinata]|uniref:SURF1-like protein n=1 Tax=Brassica carinata TaxID=52824 RepID=A0A8X7V175_BRACI|nr:hypothetical protein Bca52824_034866 [Brassica carinata]